jgi:hypothetical protein
MANEIYNTTWWGSGVCDNTIGWGIVYKPYASCYTALTDYYALRVVTDGGVVEAINCVNSADFMSNNWAYYFRVIDDGGAIESLECVIF